MHPFLFPLGRIASATTSSAYRYTASYYGATTARSQPTKTLQEESRDRLSNLQGQRGNGFSLIPRLLGGLSLGMVGAGTAVLGGVLGAAGGVLGTLASLPVAAGYALSNKGKFSDTLKAGVSYGIAGVSN